MKYTMRLPDGNNVNNNLYIIIMTRRNGHGTRMTMATVKNSTGRFLFRVILLLLLLSYLYTYIYGPVP